MARQSAYEQRVLRVMEALEGADGGHLDTEELEQKAGLNPDDKTLFYMREDDILDYDYDLGGWFIKPKPEPEPAALPVATLVGMPGNTVTPSKPKRTTNPLQEAESFIADRLHFAESVNYPFVLALFAIMTHCYQRCEFAMPYLGVRADSEGTGKSRLVELEGSMCLNPSDLQTNPTGASLLRLINHKHPTLLVDESEELQSEGTLTHKIFNAGYKPGGVVPRAFGMDVIPYNVYCPKIYGMIGDPDRTLRSRSIMVLMEKGDIVTDDKSPTFTPIGRRIGKRLNALVTPVMNEISSTYLGYKNMLNTVLPIPRDREIWECLFAICAIVAPGRWDELTEAAIAISALKTAPARRYASLEQASAESIAYEYSEYLARDSYAIAKRLGEKNIHTHVLIAELIKMPMWQHYQSPRGVKIGNKDNGHFVLAAMLQRVAGDDSQPKPVKVKGHLLRGYTVGWLEKIVRRAK